MPIARNSGINRSTADTEPVTGPQINFLHTLANERCPFGENTTAEQSLAIIDAAITAGLTKKQASTLIETFLHTPARPGAVLSNRSRTRADYETQPADRYTLNNLRDAARRRTVFGEQYTIDETIAMMEERINAGLTRAQARELRTQAWAATAHRTPDDPLFLDDLYNTNPDLPSVEDGYYALEQGDAIRFYRVWTPSNGRFAHRRLIARYSSDRADVLYRDEAITTLHGIAVDPLEAATRFARLETRCYHCGKRLTDHLSRLLLIGPDCRGFTGNGIYRPLKNIPDTAENQDRFTAFVRACKHNTEFDSLKEGLALAAEWYAALPTEVTFEDSVTRLTALLEGGFTPAETRENPDLWTVDESRLTAFAQLRTMFGD